MNDDLTLLSKPRYTLDYIKNSSNEYVDFFNSSKKYNIGKMKVSKITYCKRLPFYQIPFWIIDLDLTITKAITCYYKSILISDVDGNIYEAFKKWDQIDGNISLSKEQVLDIVKRYLKKLEEKTNSNFRICLEESFYYICRKSQINNHESIWCVAFVDEKLMSVSEQVEYIQVSDTLDNPYAKLVNER